MHARVTKFEGSPDQLDAAIKLVKETIVPAAKKLQGFKGGYWLVDRASRKGVSGTLFESEAALKAGGDAAAQRRAPAAPLTQTPRARPRRGGAQGGPAPATARA